MKATLLSLALLGVASAQNISSILTSNKETEDIREILSKFPGIAEVLGKAKGVTLFLPQDGARGLSQLANSVDRLKRIPGRVESTLQYHVATGLYPSTSIPTNAFVETLLSGGNYTSVTGGQKLQVSKAKTNGSRVYLNANGQRARVTQADIKFDGGLIHLIDAVLTPPTSPVSTARAAGLTSLTKALDDADLIPAVESARDITVFAPNNAAFFRARGPIGNFTDAQLADALKFHVVKGVGLSTALADGQIVPTLQGGSLKISVAKNGTVKVNDARVIKTDLLTKSGVIHIIDRVLVPGK